MNRKTKDTEYLSSYVAVRLTEIKKEIDRLKSEQERLTSGADKWKHTMILDEVGRVICTKCGTLEGSLASRTWCQSAWERDMFKRMLELRGIL